MEQPEICCLPEARLVFPEFKKHSLLILLQFLYTGEVGKNKNTFFSFFPFLKKSVSDLITASSLLVEFQELCRILKLNPQVRKTKFIDKPVSGIYKHQFSE